MPHMDIFNDDAFSMLSLTTAIERVPYKPSLLGSLGIFSTRPVTTEFVSMEEIQGRINLIQTDNRGAPPTQQVRDTRNIRVARTRRLALADTIYAAEIQGVRAFGSETEMQQVQSIVARRGQKLRQSLELTQELHRLGAVQGIVLDADGSTLDNWFTFWGISQPTELDFELDDANTNVRTKCAGVIRAMERAAKGAFVPGTQVHAICGDTFYDGLIDHANVRATYQNWAAAAELRTDMTFRSFPYGGIVFHNYRGTDDNSTLAVAAEKAKFFPVGAPGVFEVAYAPGEWLDVVNTPGRELYAMMIPDRDRNAWVKEELYSYPLYYCTVPAVLQRAKHH